MSMTDDMSESQFAAIIGRIKGVSTDAAQRVAKEFYSGKIVVSAKIDGPLREREWPYQVMLWACRRAREIQSKTAV